MYKLPKSPWRYILLSIVVFYAIVIALIQKVTGDTLRNIPCNVFMCLCILSFGTFLKWGTIKDAIFKKGINKPSVFNTMKSALTISLFMILVVVSFFVMAYCYQREYIITRNDIMMVACDNRFLDGQIHYYQYKNPFFCGKKIGYEEYDSDNINPLTQTPKPIPICWLFYDLEGNIIEKGSSDESEIAKNQPEKILKQKIEMKELNIDTIENRKNELVFSTSIDDFIDSYNGYYRIDQKKCYLLPKSEWRSAIYASSIHSNHETIYYNFTENEKIWPLPTISVYVPTNGDYIQEVTINFDDHSYTEEMYDLYEKICFYTLKVFFPELEDEKITELYKNLNRLAYENILPNEQGYSNNATPCALYYKNNIGLYPYFAVGESVHLCIIPVTEKTIDDYQKKGVKIHEIK